jgi:hypothetical protein
MDIPTIKRERGKNQVHKRHPAAATATVAEMNHPIRHNLPRARQVVHVNHHEHDEAAEGINRGDANRKGGGGLGTARGRLGGGFHERALFGAITATP